MTDTRFESKLLDHEAAAAYFWSPTCQKCQILGQRIKSLIKSRNIPLYEVNVSVEFDIALRFNVLSFPTLIFSRNGQENLRLTATTISMVEIEKACEELICANSQLPEQLR